MVTDAFGLVAASRVVHLITEPPLANRGFGKLTSFDYEQFSQMPALQSPTTVEEYLSSLTPDRRAALNAVRGVILKNLPKGYEERIQYGMIAYVVPHSIYPAGYHCKPEDALPYASLGSTKTHMALHSMAVYGDPKTEAWFRSAYARSGQKLDMGKSCIRFKRLEDLPLEVIGQLIARIPLETYVARVEQSLKRRKREKN